MKNHHRPALFAAIAIALLAACGSDSADTAESTASTTAATLAPETTAAPVASNDAGGEEPFEVVIEARDYAFDDVPDAVPVGTKFALSNGSNKEVHEVVAVRLADDETRSAAELVTLPPDQLGALIGPGPATVVVAPPGEDGFAVVGDGALHEAGRYLIVCTIPLGADPAEFLAAAQSSDGPPQVAGGAPHFTAGMFAEIVVDPEL